MASIIFENESSFKLTIPHKAVLAPFLKDPHQSDAPVISVDPSIFNSTHRPSSHDLRPANQKAQFPQFAKLSPELQMIIFKEALPEGRIVKIKAVEYLVDTPDKWTHAWYSDEVYGGKYKSAKIAVSTTLPALLHTNSMAREIAQKEYQLEFSHCLPHPVYFNFDKDTLFIQSDRANKLFQGTLHMIKRFPTPLSNGLDIAKMEEKLKYLMFGEPCLFRSTTEMISRMGNLQLLELKQGCFTKEQKVKILNTRWNDRWEDGGFPYALVELSDKDMCFKVMDKKDGYAVYGKTRRSPRLIELEAKNLDSHEFDEDEA
ncbi:hypothetical protein DSL72_000052 [Monilinia vaccinii-corymbosi]|uniref:2EXR domain-containing protein n=1 Tax=Monilinia vaccinii-corymbosi TaxID=61207 RepID=A0A8A3P862_9HELO|nr:hypothetical protein DSL72_000052 [Monilinia vaccinii-corymbosi]